MLRTVTSFLLALGLVTGCTIKKDAAVEPLEAVDGPDDDDSTTSSDVKSHAKDDVTPKGTKPPVVDATTAPAPPKGATARCDVTKPFDRPELLTTITSLQDDVYPVLSQDELTMWFTRFEVGAWANPTTWTASRISPTGLFSTPSRITIVPNAMRLSILGSLAFADVRDSASNLRHIHGDLMPQIGDAAEQAEPFLANKTSVYYTTNVTGVWQLRHVSRGVGSADANIIPQANTHQVWPVVSPDERTIYYASQPADHSSALDITVATRASADDAWGTPTTVEELSGPTNDMPSWISADGCTMAMSSNRNGDSLDIYLAHKPL